MSYIKKKTKGTTEYKPKNPEKYKGKPPIICRSSWEDAFCRFLDNNNNVLYWNSEEIGIKYKDPITPIDKFGKPKIRTYYPDFLVRFINGQTWLIEIKPYKETKQPTNHGNKTAKTKLYEAKTWEVNKAKWQAADRYCKLKNWKFKILTEKELLI